MSGLQSLYSLLDKRLDFPCINAAHEFVSSLKSENDRLSLATNGLVPLLENGDVKIPLRILAGYLLYAIYNFTNTENPFYDRLVKLYKIQRIQSLPASELFIQSNINTQQGRTQLGFEGVPSRNIRAKLQDSIPNSSYSDATESFVSPPAEGNASPFECALWKILKGEGDELGLYPATTLADVDFWTPGRYQRRFGDSIHTVSNAPPLPSNTMPAASFNIDPYHTIPTPPSSTLPYQSTISRVHLDVNKLLPNPSVNYRSLGHASTHAGGNGIAPPMAHKSIAAPDSSRPSLRPSPMSHSLQLSPSSASASSTLDSSSVRTPVSFVDSSTFALPRTDPTRQVDASTFHIPQINRWSTSADVALNHIKDDFKPSPLPPLADRRTNVIPPKSSQPIRNPGVIGSGRPSSTSPSEPSSERSAERRASYIGIVGDDISTAPAGYPSNGSLLHKAGDNDSHHHSLLAPGLRQVSPFTAASAFPSNFRTTLPPAITQPPIATQLTPLQDVNADPLMTTNSLRNVSQAIAGDAIKDMRRVHGVTLSGQSNANSDAVAGREPGQNILMNQGSYSKHRAVDLPAPHDQSLQQELTSQKENASDLEAVRERDELANAIVLYLMARERVLTLQEQKKLGPHLSMLTRPICILRPEDIPSLVANNQDIAVKLLLYLFNREDEDAREIEELLKKVDLDREHEGSLGSDSAGSLSLVSEMVKLVSNYGSSSSQTSTTSDGISLSPPLGGRGAMRRYLVALAELPPTIQSFSVVGKLLMPNPNQSEQGREDSKRIAALIRTEVLGAFISGCIRWIERVDRDEKEGKVHDDRVATATGNLCRFYTSLIRNGIIAADSEEDTTEIMSFALQFSRFDTAQKLYSTLAAARA